MVDEQSGEKVAQKEKYERMLEQTLRERTRLLEEKTRELEALTNNIFGGVEVCSFDEKFSVLFVSAGFTKMTGYTLEELTQLDDGHMAIVLPEDAEQMKQEIAQQLEECENFSVEYRLICKNGRIICVLDKGNMLNKEDGTKQVQCILTDITAQKEQEETLRVSEKRYEIVMKLLGVSMFEYNIVTNELILFEQDANMYDIPRVVAGGPDSFLRMGIIQPQSGGVYLEMYRKIRAGEPYASCCVSTKDRDGRMYDYELSLTTVYLPNGRPIRAIGAKRDITLLHRLEKEREFAQTMLTDRWFVCEANLTEDCILQASEVQQQRSVFKPGIMFSKAIHLFCEELVAPEHRQMVTNRMLPEYLIKKYQQGASLVTFSYRRKMYATTYEWYESYIHIIQETSSGQLMIRIYHSNINDRKRKEEKNLEKQRFRDAITSKAVLAYEFNLTQDVLIQGHEGLDKSQITALSGRFSTLIKEFVQKYVHPEHKADFYQTFQRENLLKLYEKGEQEVSCQYRRLDAEKEMVWVNCTMYLLERPETGDVGGYAYVENIDEQKKAELALQYKAEHDALTEFYNKESVQLKIDQFLASWEGRRGVHAFLMIDIDYFKLVNDNFGHLFGDTVLSDTAKRIGKLFREEDILGRIGGDEFCVLIKNLPSVEVASLKADQVCEAARVEYRQSDKTCSISVSIGVSFSGRQGASYQELYKNADAALYISKNEGRNRFTIS